MRFRNLPGANGQAAAISLPVMAHQDRRILDHCQTGQYRINEQAKACVSRFCTLDRILLIPDAATWKSGRGRNEDLFSPSEQIRTGAI
jgi:hypothetical protein